MVLPLSRMIGDKMLEELWELEQDWGLDPEIEQDWGLSDEWPPV